MSDEPPLTLHAHPLSSYCWKVLLALYETQTPFRQHAVAGSPKEDPVLTAYWPIGKMPVLQDATRDTAVPESSIIIEYLQQYYPTKTLLIPADPKAALETRQWDRFFDLYVHNSMQKRVVDRLRPEGQKDPAGVLEADATLATAYTMLEQRMATREFVAGDFSMADCAAMPALFYAEAIHPFSKTHSALAAYFDRLISRPAARRIILEAQPYFKYFPFHDTLHPRFLEYFSTTLNPERPMKIIPYLSYSGNCAEAFKFYESATGGKIEMMMTYGQAPPGEPVPPSMTDKVMHATITIGDNAIMGSDAPAQYASTPAGFSVSINVDSSEEADRLYTALSEGGTIKMPITETFWAQRFAMFIDKFNIPWMINCEKPMG